MPKLEQEPHTIALAGMAGLASSALLAASKRTLRQMRVRRFGSVGSTRCLVVTAVRIGFISRTRTGVSRAYRDGWQKRDRSVKRVRHRRLRRKRMLMLISGTQEGEEEAKDSMSLKGQKGDFRTPKIYLGRLDVKE